MKFQIQADALGAATGWAARIAPQRPRVPVTAGVRLSLAEGQLSLAASDYEVFGELTLPVDASPDEGCVVVSARLLGNVVRALRATDIVELERSEGSPLRLRCGRFSWTLPVMDDRDWPPFPAAGEPLGCLPGTVLSAALARVLPIVAAEGPPEEITSVLFVIRREGLTLVATNRLQMATAALSWQPALTAQDTELDLIVPPELLKLGLAGNGMGEVSLCSDGNTVALVTPGRRITGRLGAGRFPRWQPLMAQPAANAATTLAVETAELRDAVAKVSALADRNAKAPDLLRLDFTSEGIEVTLAAQSADTGGDGAIEHLNWQGPSVTMGITPQCLLDALDCLHSPTAAFTFTAAPTQPFELRPADEKGVPLDDGYHHILMQRKVTRGDA